jgi:hypothetical protein
MVEVPIRVIPVRGSRLVPISIGALTIMMAFVNATGAQKSGRAPEAATPGDVCKIDIKSPKEGDIVVASGVVFVEVTVAKAPKLLYVWLLTRKGAERHWGFLKTFSVTTSELLKTPVSYEQGSNSIRAVVVGSDLNKTMGESKSARTNIDLEQDKGKILCESTRLVMRE